MSNYAEMSDEAFEALLEQGGAPAFLEDTQEEQQQAAPDEQVQGDADALDTQEQDQQEQEQEQGQEEEVSTDAGDADTQEEQVQEQEKQEVPAELAALFEPIDVNGSPVAVQNIEEARKLMAMGVSNSNFVKQHRKTIRTLEDAKIDEATLNMLLDVAQGKPEAIAQLVKKHNIDTMTLDEIEGEYTPSNHIVSNEAIALDEVLDSIQHTPTFSKTTDIVTNVWDKASREAIFAKPEFLAELNEHVKDGTYDKVMAEVTRTRLFGGFAGMSDLQAYASMGQQMRDAGSLTPAVPTVVTRKPKQVDTKNVGAKKKASPTRSTHVADTGGEPDFRGMDDDAFEAYLNSHKRG